MNFKKTTTLKHLGVCRRDSRSQPLPFCIFFSRLYQIFSIHNIIGTKIYHITFKVHIQVGYIFACQVFHVFAFVGRRGDFGLDQLMSQFSSESIFLCELANQVRRKVWRQKQEIYYLRQLLLSFLENYHKLSKTILDNHHWLSQNIFRQPLQTI